MVSALDPALGQPTVGPLTISVEILNDAPLPEGFVIEYLEALVEFVCNHESARGAWEIAIRITSDASLRELHARFLGVDEATDVMAFPRSPGERHARENEDKGGDIVISVDRAVDQAKDFGNSAVEEIYFLAVHGILHLLGWVDATAAERDEMLRRQADLIASFESAKKTVGRLV